MTDLHIAITALLVAQKHLARMHAEAQRALDELHAAIDLVESGSRFVAQLRDAEANKK